MFKEPLFRITSTKSSAMLTQYSYRCAGTDTLKDKEKADERIFFTKQDGKFDYYPNCIYAKLRIYDFNKIQMVNNLLYREGIERFDE